MMKKQIRHICVSIGQCALLAILSAGWWGLLYPNFSMTQETYRAVPKDDTHDSAKSGAESFFEMLQAKPGELVMKSRAAEWIWKWSGALRSDSGRKEEPLGNGETDGERAS